MLRVALTEAVGGVKIAARTAARQVRRPPAAHAPVVVRTLSSSSKTNPLKIAHEATLLTLMGAPGVSRVASKVLAASQDTSLIGTVARNMAKPWTDLFCEIGTPQQVIDRVVAKGQDPGQIAFDFGEEHIPHPSQAAGVVANYNAYLDDSRVTRIATKITGVCPASSLALNDPHHPDVLAGEKWLETTVAKAHKNGQTVIIDAEEYAVENEALGMAFRLAQKYPKTVVVTLQALRLDSMARLQHMLAELPEGVQLRLKLVNGAYMSDLVTFPDQFNQTIDATHANYRDLMAFAAQHPARIDVMACTHNPELMNIAFKNGWLVGNLRGMTLNCPPGGRMFEYLPVHHDPAKMAEYMGRRFVEYAQKGLHNRRPMQLWESLRRTLIPFIN